MDAPVSWLVYDERRLDAQTIIFYPRLASSLLLVREREVLLSQCGGESL